MKRDEGQKNDGLKDISEELDSILSEYNEEKASELILKTLNPNE